MTYSLSPGSKIMQHSPIGPVKIMHDAPRYTHHRKRLDLFLKLLSSKKWMHFPKLSVALKGQNYQNNLKLQMEHM